MLIFESESQRPLESAASELLSRRIACRTISVWGRNFLVVNTGASQQEVIIEILASRGCSLTLEINSESPLSSRSLKHESSEFELAKGVRLSDATTLFIGGPCAIESRSQIEETAEELSSMGIRALRAGAFKPRTSIYTFQGLEYKGLEILREVADKYNMIVVSEAKDSSHIDAVAQYSDVVQIGTKSMYIFDLLRRAGELGKPVMLKRGFMTTIKEYMQALDVILATGNERVIMCERGLRTFENQTRFTLDLAGAAVMKLNSHLPLVIDPSHTTGRRDIVAPLCQASVALGVEGLLVEIHPNPENALSDREQAFPLADVKSLINRLRSIADSIDRKLI